MDGMRAARATSSVACWLAVSTTFGVTTRSGATSRSQPSSTRRCASALRTRPEMTSAQPSSSCRTRAASRVCTYGLSGSACSGSLSSQTAIIPNRSAGA